jgi:hypothetical protein
MGNVSIYKSAFDKEPAHELEAEGKLLDWLMDNIGGFDPLSSWHPFTVLINGVLVNERYWPVTRIKSSDVVEWRAMPQDPVSWGVATWIMIASAAISAGALIYAMSMKKGLSGNGVGAQGSAITSASATANQPKLFGVVRELFGQHICYPDYLNQPRKWFSGIKEQSMDVLMAIGVGHYDLPISRMFIGETNFETFDGFLNYSLFDPGVNVSSHQAHKCWYNAPEVGYTDSSFGLRLTAGAYGTKYMSGSQYVISGQQITIPIGSGSPPADWEVGSKVSITTPNIPFTVVDGGWNGNPLNAVFYRDIVSGEFSKLSLTNNTITISGASANNGTYRIFSYTAGVGTAKDQMTLDVWDTRVINGVSTTGWFPATTLTVGSFTGDIQKEGTLYQINSLITETVDTDEVLIGFSFTRLLPNGVTVDPAWSGFQNEGTITNATIELDASSIVGGWLGWFPVCPSGETTSLIEWDLTTPSGFGKINNGGGIEGRSRHVQYQIRRVGETNPVIDNYYTIAGASRDQLGWSPQQVVANGRYEMRIRRIGAEDTATDSMDTINWFGLKSLLPTPTSYAGITTLALTLTGSDTIASQTENKINVVPQRKLQIVQNGAFTTTLHATNDIAPVVRYIAHSVGYGDDQIDIAELIRLDAVWKARGDTFKYIYDSNVVVRDAINTALNVGFSEMTVSQGKIKPVRDEPRDMLNAHMYTPQNMTKALKTNFSVVTPEESDGIRVTYVDEDTWEEATVLCLLPTDAGFKLDEITIDGVTTRDKAYQLGMRQRSIQFHRRKKYSFSTEMDALNSEYWSTAVLGDDIPSYAQSGIMWSIQAQGADKALIQSSEVFTWKDGSSHVVSWRKANGKIAGPFPCTKVSDFYLLATIGSEPLPTINGTQEPPHLLFGTSTEYGYPAIVTKVAPSGRFDIAVEAVNYSANVYAYDDAAADN